MTDQEQEIVELKKHFAALAKVMSKSNKLLLENSKTSKMFKNIQKLATKTMGDYHKRVKKGDGYFHEFNDAIDAAKKDLGGFSKKLKGIPSPLGLVMKGLSFLKDAVFSVGTAMVKTALALSDVTTKVSGVEDLVNLGTDEIPYLGKVLQEVGKEIDSNVNVFTELSKIGASFGSSIIQLRAAQVEAVMPLSKFMDLIGGNSTILAKLFGSVSEGVPQITRLTKELRNITERDFAKFGLTLDDTSEYMMTYLELERARGNTDRMSRRQLLDGTANYTKNLVILSKLTGKSVDELNDANMAQAADGVMQSQLSKMSAKDAKMLTTNINALPGPMRQFAKEMLFLGAPISDVSRDLEAMSQGKYGEAFKKFKEDLDPIAFQNAIKEIGKEVMYNADAFGKATLAGGGFGEALNAVAETLGTAIDPEKIKNEMEARGDNIVSLRNLTSQLDVTKTEFEDIRLGLAKALLYDKDSVVDIGGQLSRHLKEINEGPLKDFKNKITGFSDWLGGKKEKDIKDPDAKKKWWQGNGQKSSRWGSGYEISEVPGSTGGWQGYAESLANKQLGTYGTTGKMFENFGPGTPVNLHGSEAVVPENTAFGQALAMLETIKNSKKSAEDIGSIATAKKSAENIGSIATAKNQFEEIGKQLVISQGILTANEKMTNLLNKLIAINMATERNTKSTHKGLAELSGTLV